MTGIMERQARQRKGNPIINPINSPNGDVSASITPNIGKTFEFSPVKPNMIKGEEMAVATNEMNTGIIGATCNIIKKAIRFLSAPLIFLSKVGVFETLPFLILY